jgi:hypothetical protein
LTWLLLLMLDAFQHYHVLPSDAMKRHGFTCFEGKGHRVLRCVVKQVGLRMATATEKYHFSLASLSPVIQC